jgi:O-acetylserine/cysteine efflux transporter
VLKNSELLLAASVPLLWGIGFTFAKAGLNEFPPLFLMGLRFTLAALTLVWFVPIPRGQLKQIFWISLVGSTLQYGMTFTGLSMLDASLAIIIIHLEVPFSVLLAAIVLKDKPGSQRILGMLISFAGIVLIAGQPSLSEQLPAILLTAAGAMTWAVGQIMVKRLENPPSGFALTAWIGVSWIGWGVILYLALIMTVLGYGIWYHVLSRNHVSKVMPVMLLLPVFTIASSMLFLGEEPSPMIFIGAAVVIGGVSMIVITKDSKLTS